MLTIRAISSRERMLPVGLLGFTIEISLVFGAASDSNSSRFSRQLFSWRSCVSFTRQPAFFASPHTCRYPGETTMTSSPASSKVLHTNQLACAAPTVTDTFLADPLRKHAALHSPS